MGGRISGYFYEPEPSRNWLMNWFMPPFLVTPLTDYSMALAMPNFPEDHPGRPLLIKYMECNDVYGHVAAQDKCVDIHKDLVEATFRWQQIKYANEVTKHYYWKKIKSIFLRTQPVPENDCEYELIHP